MYAKKDAIMNYILEMHMKTQITIYYLVHYIVLHTSTCLRCLRFTIPFIA